MHGNQWSKAHDSGGSKGRPLRWVLFTRSALCWSGLLISLKIMMPRLFSLFGWLWLAAGPALAQRLPLPPNSGAASPALVSADDPPAVQQQLFRAAAFVARFQDSEALGRYQAVLKMQPLHYLALWQAAVLSVKIGQRYTDETRKQAYYDAATDYAARALALRPEGGEANYAAALALFSQATLRHARGRLAAYRELRSYVFLATEKRPDLPDAWQLLGRWQYRLAHYNLLERLASRLFFGSTPTATSLEAMSSLERARDLAPNRLQFRYDLARMYRYQGRRRRAIAELEAAAAIPPVTSEDLIVSRLCRQLLPPLQRAAARRERRRRHVLRVAPGAAEGLGQPGAGAGQQP